MVFTIAVCWSAGRNKPRPSALRLAVYLSLGLLAVFSLSYFYYPGELDEAAETMSLEITFEEQDARLLANQMRGFELGALEVGIQAPDSSTWIVSGPAADVLDVQLLARALDSTHVTPEHVVRTYEIEHRDARSLANASRDRGPLGRSVEIIVSAEGSWYVIVKQEDVEALESWLAEIDSPDLRTVMLWYYLLIAFTIAVGSYASRNKPRPSALRMAVYLSLALIAIFSISYFYYDAESDEAVETVSLEITFEEQDARLLANQMRGFELGALEAGIQAPDSSTWIVSGPAADVRDVQLLARALDSTHVTPEHVVRTYEIEHHDARSLANATRGLAPEGLSVGIVVSPEGSWYVIVKQEDVEALESWLAEIDSPDLRITSEGVLEAV